MNWKRIAKKYQFAVIDNQTGKRDSLHETRADAEETIDTKLAIAFGNGETWAERDDWRIEERPSGNIRIMP